MDLMPTTDASHNVPSTFRSRGGGIWSHRTRAPTPWPTADSLTANRNNI